MRAGSNTTRSAAIPTAIRPRSNRLNRFAASEVILRIASSMPITRSCRTYCAITRGNEPKARGCAPVADAMFVGEASVQKLTKGVRSARCFCSSFMLFGFTLTPPVLRSSKNVVHASSTALFRSTCDRFAFYRFSFACAMRMLSQSLPACRYQFSQSEVLSISRLNCARISGSASLGRNASAPAAKWRG